MEFILNEELIPFVNSGKMGLSEIESLILIREFINRISSRKYIEDEVVSEVYRKHDALPTVITWGDYFLTELVYDIINSADKNFKKAIATIKYDIISSHIIFSDKDGVFFEWVESNYQLFKPVDNDIPCDEYEEAVHLKILKDYYVGLGIVDRFTKEELSWYGSYEEATAV